MIEPKTPIESLVKCACGLTMLRARWRDHWVTCAFGSPCTVTPRDHQDFEANQVRMAEALAEHLAWVHQSRKRKEIHIG